MTLSEINAIVSGAGMPVTYHAWPPGEAPQLPWVAIVEPGSDNFAADGIVYHAVKNIDIELYTKAKDPAAESAVEAALANAGIFWQKTETYLEGEQCFLQTYEIEV